MVEVTNRRGVNKLKPNIIRDYNKGMSGVDRADQMVSYYNCLKKNTRWYKKVAIHIFDIFVFNVYCLNCKYETDKAISLLKFREISATNLLCEHLNEETLVPQVNNNKLHYLTAIPPN
ncbi:piggyBac transposable element-derived protein 4-like [Hydra vulgaris]|uniref:piggyBac transposable element-derived protein 4-like n=1 Tax=Hydra vulgaris TaxID=6087 RepID=UPI001F5E9262|nr:piggyBac transposable element-derived protein 4-like [Hydra vulgaris]